MIASEWAGGERDVSKIAVFSFTVVRGGFLIFFTCLCYLRLACVSASARKSRVARTLEHLECSHQPHIQGRGAQKRTGALFSSRILLNKFLL